MKKLIKETLVAHVGAGAGKFVNIKNGFKMEVLTGIINVFIDPSKFNENNIIINNESDIFLGEDFCKEILSDIKDGCVTVNDSFETVIVAKGNYEKTNNIFKKVVKKSEDIRNQINMFGKSFNLKKISSLGIVIIELNKVEIARFYEDSDAAIEKVLFSIVSKRNNVINQLLKASNLMIFQKHNLKTSTLNGTIKRFGTDKFAFVSADLIAKDFFVENNNGIFSSLSFEEAKNIIVDSFSEIDEVSTEEKIAQ